MKQIPSNQYQDIKMSDLISVSKTMSYILRHGAIKEGIKMDESGWVLFSELRKCKGMRGVPESVIYEVVRTNEKKRFALCERDGVKYIRANQGHSASFAEVIDETKLLTLIKEPIRCLHGTDPDSWEKIKLSGLKPMGRTHIHMAKDFYGKVISGARKSASVFIEIDMELAMKDGIEFFMSSNEVILCSQDIIPKYFKEVHYL